MEKLSRISIHSLIRGRTTIQPIGEPLNACISIHSLIRGRTQPRKSVSLLYRISIHSLIRGRTLTNAADCNSHGKFQSTPSYEGEPVSEPISSLTSYFNPLPHTRENYIEWGSTYLTLISIHSLIRGRTKTIIGVLYALHHFNPLPHTRENNSMSVQRIMAIYFNPLPHTRENI